MGVRTIAFILAVAFAQPVLANTCGFAAAPAVGAAKTELRVRSFARWTGILAQFGLEAVTHRTPESRLGLIQKYYKQYGSELTPSRLATLLKSSYMIPRSERAAADAQAMLDIVLESLRSGRGTIEERRLLFHEAASKLPAAVTEGGRFNAAGERLLRAAQLVWPDGSHVLRSAYSVISNAVRASSEQTLSVLEVFRVESLKHDAAQVEWFAKELLDMATESKHAPISRVDAIRVLAKRWGDVERELVVVDDSRPAQIFATTMKNQNFEQKRPLDSYYRSLYGFKKRLQHLVDGQVWIDVGAGAGRAIHDYLVRTSSFITSATAIAINAESPKFLAFIERIEEYQAAKFKNIISRVEDIPAGSLPRADVLTDFYAAASYSLRLDAVLGRYLEFLRVGGTAHIYLATGQSEIRLRGQPISAAEWLALGRGLSVEGTESHKSIITSIQVTKISEDANVHALVTTSYEAGFPPKRVTEVVILPETQQ
ncbi:MAG TPA: hypothetical protein VFV50_19190 [Bdellovibrionales bacterium]|nr:hypothetical protein [Bdellovibrionales bacterium]